jgi:hypothetical protein
MGGQMLFSIYKAKKNIFEKKKEMGYHCSENKYSI